MKSSLDIQLNFLKLSLSTTKASYMLNIFKVKQIIFIEFSYSRTHNAVVKEDD